MTDLGQISFNKLYTSIVSHIIYLHRNSWLGIIRRNLRQSWSRIRGLVWMIENLVHYSGKNRSEICKLPDLALGEGQKNEFVSRMWVLNFSFCWNEMLGCQNSGQENSKNKENGAPIWFVTGTVDVKSHRHRRTLTDLDAVDGYLASRDWMCGFDPLYSTFLGWFVNICRHG